MAPYTNFKDTFTVEDYKKILNSSLVASKKIFRLLKFNKLSFKDHLILKIRNKIR